MGRPALAAERSGRILDFLASLAGQRFTLSEIARATQVNGASCLAILSELHRQGHVCRHPTSKTYWLGSALVAIGASALEANPLLGRARAEAARLRDELGLAVLLSTRISEDILGIFSLPDSEGRTAGLNVGERVPFVPPIGMSFAAWLAPHEIEAWIDQRRDDGTATTGDRLRETLAFVRQQGFHVTLRRPDVGNIATILTRAAAGERPMDAKHHMTNFIAGLDIAAGPSDARNPEAVRDVHLIAAPIIDRETSVHYALCVGGFRAPLTDPMITQLGQRLIIACVAVMNNDLARPASTRPLPAL